MKTIFCVIYSFAFILQVVRSENLPVKWKRRKEECKMLQDHVTGQQSIHTLYSCLAFCEMETNCESVSWQIRESVCLLSGKNVVDDKRSQFIKWELSPGWFTYSKVIYPVARVLNPAHDKDLMTHAEAVQECTAQGSTIVTPTDLLDARNAGMDTCACGWISNGQNGGVTPLSGICDLFVENTNNDIEYCGNPKAMAWCKLK